MIVISREGLCGERKSVAWLDRENSHSWFLLLMQHELTS
jgi:hypothetical protein